MLFRMKERVVLIANPSRMDQRIDQEDPICIQTVPGNPAAYAMRFVHSDVEPRREFSFVAQDSLQVFAIWPHERDRLEYLLDRGRRERLFKTEVIDGPAIAFQLERVQDQIRE